MGGKGGSKTEKVGEGGGLLLHPARTKIGDGFFQCCQAVTKATTGGKEHLMVNEKMRVITAGRRVYSIKMSFLAQNNISICYRWYKIFGRSELKI